MGGVGRKIPLLQPVWFIDYPAGVSFSPEIGHKGSLWVASHSQQRCAGKQPPLHCAGLLHKTVPLQDERYKPLITNN